VSVTGAHLHNRGDLSPVLNTRGDGRGDRRRDDRGDRRRDRSPRQSLRRSPRVLFSTLLDPLSAAEPHE